ncbi:hypothetical protein ACOSQ3_030578 [Xanthoceras sorbifolium]
MVYQEIPNKLMHKQLLHLQDPTVATLEDKPLKAMLLNCICRVNSSILDDIPLLQRRPWSVGSFELLVAIYFPVEMHLVQNKIGTCTVKWIVLRTFSLICLLVTIITLVASIEGLISAKSS